MDLFEIENETRLGKYYNQENMNLLIFNCGSSSQSFKLYQIKPDNSRSVIASGKAHNIQMQTNTSASLNITIHGVTRSLPLAESTHPAAASAILASLLPELAADEKIDAIGHRFVHGGGKFERTTFIDDSALNLLRSCLHIAPIHNPNSYSVIETCRALLPNTPQFAVFDTAFHASLPDAAVRYAIPQKLTAAGYRKFGFHGLSYQFITGKMADLLQKPADQLKLVICHLGTGGSSVCAIQNGKSVDTSMGYSPIAGLIMSTRSGDVDPEIILELVRHGQSADEIDNMLNFESGLLALSGYSSNLYEIITAAQAGNSDCRLAFEAYCLRLSHYIGAFLWQLDGADALVFTDEIGTGCPEVREAVCANRQFFGIRLDQTLNQNAPPSSPCCISQDDSSVQIWSVPTDEEAVIVDEILKLLS